MPFTAESSNTVDMPEHRHRWQSLLKMTNTVQLALTTLTIFFWLIAWLISKQDVLLQAILLTIFVWIFTGISLLMTIPNKGRWLEAATFIVIGGLLVTIITSTAIVGTNSGMLACLIWLPMLASVLGLSTLWVSIVTGLSIATIIISLYLEFSNTVKPSLNLVKDFPVAIFLIWCLALMLALTGLLIFKRRVETALKDRSDYSAKMEKLNDHLKSIAVAGSDISLQVNSMSLELKATSQQQASGAAEQSSAVIAITTSLEEMGQSATQITDNANQVYEAAEKSLVIAQEVKQVSETADFTARRGRESVENSIQSIEQVRTGIEALAQRLLALTSSSNQIGAIIDIIEGIADETHLLALNAAIESAGSGEKGQRFGVIASEVKSLADRAIESTKEIKQIIAILQGAVAGAVLSAEETKKETSKAVHKSYEAGLIINEVGQVVNVTAERNSSIVEYVEKVCHLAEEISLAMRQQQTVNGQLINTVQSIKGVAQESASGSRQVAESAQSLSDMIFQLKDILSMEQANNTEGLNA